MRTFTSLSSSSGSAAGRRDGEELVAVRAGHEQRAVPLVVRRAALDDGSLAGCGIDARRGRLGLRAGAGRDVRDHQALCGDGGRDPGGADAGVHLVHREPGQVGAGQEEEREPAGGGLGGNRRDDQHAVAGQRLQGGDVVQVDVGGGRAPAGLDGHGGLRPVRGAAPGAPGDERGPAGAGDPVDEHVAARVRGADVGVAPPRRRSRRRRRRRRRWRGPCPARRPAAELPPRGDRPSRAFPPWRAPRRPGPAPAQGRRRRGPTPSATRRR